MSIYNPLGLIVGFLVYVKILLQKSGRSIINWDEEITDAQNQKWLSFFKSRRCSEYLLLYSSHDYRCTTVDSVTYICRRRALVEAKTKGAQQKLLSISRLELQAEIFSRRLANNIVCYLTVYIIKRCFCSNFKTTLCWFKI